MELPVYMITGFLESGKTSFILDTISDKQFSKGQRTLIIACEEGEVEYAPDILKAAKAEVEFIEDEEEFNPEHLSELVKKHRPTQIMLEYNGMWKLEKLMQAFPARWELYQIVTTVDATTFELYSNNIGPMMFEHITTADLVVINRCTDELKDMLYKKNIKAMNPRAAIYLDDVNGNSEDYARNMPLPFDVDADIIDIQPEDYGLWYIDATGDPMKYDGKTVRFLAQAYVGKDVPAGSFVPGRFGMVCCADDVTFLGFLCRYPDRDQLHNRDWVKVTASITVEELPQYRGPGPVLHAITVEPAEKAKEDIVYFN